MRTGILLITVLLMGYSFGQQPVINKVTTEICDSLKKINKPINELTKDESKGIILTILMANYSDWTKELNEFSEKTGRGKYEFDNYLQHVLQLDCELYRIIANKLDPYLKGEEGEVREMYLKTRAFIIALENNLPNDSLRNYLNDSLWNETTLRFLTSGKAAIDTFKRSTTLNIMLVYADGYTFTVRYFDYLTGEPEFEIDVIFRDESDLVIDQLVLKNKALLLEELQERLEYNKKIDNGEIELPPPPPPVNSK